MEYRIIDANINRLNEGLRVIEDILRFYFNDKKYGKSLKKIRHKIKKFTDKNYFELVKHRDVINDKNKYLNPEEEFSRETLKDLFIANFKRIEESCRVLEEVLKIENKGYSELFKEIRFEIYQIEKNIVEKYKKILTV